MELPIAVPTRDQTSCARLIQIGKVTTIMECGKNSCNSLKIPHVNQ